METERIQEYLEAIYKRQGSEAPVATSALADDLKVTQPAVTDMLRSLENKGFINYKPGRGAVLTELGSEKALGVIRRHRLWERFLVDVLGMEWDQVHEQACRLEHVTSPEMEERMASLLGHADTCPHGHSIPDRNGNIKKESATALTRFKPGQKLYIQAVDKEDAGVLHRITQFGLQPPSIISITKKEKNGGMEIELAGEKIRLDADTASALLATPYEGEIVQASEEMPLSRLEAGHTGTVKTCEGGQSRLGRCLSLGFTPGSQLKMLENFNHGPVLVRLHDTEVALGREMADHVIVIREEAAC